MTAGTVDGASRRADTSKTVAIIGRDAFVWLVSLLDRLPAQGDRTVRALCHVLVASWIADRMAAADEVRSGRFSDVAMEVARLLNAQADSERSDNVKPTLKLIVEVLLASEGLRVESFREFLTETISILRRPEPSLIANRSLMEKRILLNGVGALPSAETPSADGLRELLKDFTLAAPAGVVDAVTLELECLTGWGTRQVDSQQIAPALGDIMAGFAIQQLRLYELIPAARLMRLVEYLTTSGIMARRDDLNHVLWTHHRRHGPFGWYGPEAAKLRQLPSPTDRDRDVLADAELYLPATLECLWTLAEVSTRGWRLFDRLPAYAHEGGW